MALCILGPFRVVDRDVEGTNRQLRTFLGTSPTDPKIMAGKDRSG